MIGVSIYIFFCQDCPTTSQKPNPADAQRKLNNEAAKRYRQRKKEDQELSKKGK